MKQKPFILLIIMLCVVVFSLYFVFLFNSTEYQIKRDSYVSSNVVIQNNNTVFPSESGTLLNVLLNNSESVLPTETPVIPETFSINIKVKKTTSDGKTVESLTEAPIIDIPLSFLTEKNQFTNYEDGKFVFQFYIKTDTPKKPFDLDTNLKVVINDKQIKSYLISGGGLSDESKTGLLSVNSQDGLLLINLGELESLLVNGDNKLELLLENIKIMNSKEVVKTINSYKLYELILEKSESKTIILDEFGKPLKIYSSDIDFVVSSFATSSREIGNCKTSWGGVCYQSDVVKCVGKPAPYVGNIVLKEKMSGKVVATSPYFDSNGGGYNAGECIAWFDIGGNLLNTKLQRNNEYIIEIGSPQNITFEFKTPETKTSYYYRCSGEMGLYGCGTNVFKNQ